MDEILRKKLLGLQKPFNSEDLTPKETGAGIPAMSEVQRKLFEKAVQGTGSPIPVPSQELTDAEAAALRKEFGDEIQPPVRYQKLFNK